jgi:hypothetical protein
MKHLFTFLVLILLGSACRKESPSPEKSYLQGVEKELKDRLGESDFGSLDFGRAIVSRVDSVARYFVRIPLRGEQLNKHFLLVRTWASGRIQEGKWVALEGSMVKKEGGERVYNGTISIQSLDRETSITSPIQEGIITLFHSRHQQARISLVAPDYVLPEVVVVGYYPKSGGVSYSTWMNLQALFYDSGRNYDRHFYDYIEGGPDGGGSGNWSSGGSSGEGAGAVPPMEVDYEWDVYKEGIDLERYLACFDAVPDGGAACSIEIFSDIPVDSDPNKILNFTSGSPGHVFLQIKKSNGNQSVVQNIGFYPQNGWKTLLTTVPVEGKLVDNGGHEFNASLRMDISPESLKSILTEMRYLARFIRYDIDEYNCTDFALDVFNKARSSKLEVPMYRLPGSTAPGGSRTPQGLYNALKGLKESGHGESAAVTIGDFKNWVGHSNGPCN